MYIYRKVRKKGWKMKTWLTIIAAASLMLLPVATLAADSGQLSSNQNPPVAQPLVREGDFAIKLAAELNLGKANDEETAVTLLAQAGIAPANGWIPDYPVTPQIVGQLSEAIAQAVTDGSLLMDPGDADQVLNRVAAEMTLPEPAGSAGSETAATAPSDSTVINGYYASEGPPIITYYAPPLQYAYLYDWVPYPAYWYGYWFPGFYICHNFTTTVFVGNSFHHGHGHGDFHGHGDYPAHHDPGMRRAIVSNHFQDPVTGGRVVVAPIVRTAADGTHPSTILRGQGRSFMTVGDLRRGYAINGARPAMSQTGNTPGFSNGGADRPAMQGQGRMSRPVFVMQTQSPMPQSPSLREDQARTSRSPFVGQNDARTPRTPLAGQNDSRTSRSPLIAQNSGRILRPSYMVQNQGRLFGGAAMRGSGTVQSGRFNAPYTRDTGGRAVVQGGGGARRGGW